MNKSATGYFVLAFQKDAVAFIELKQCGTLIQAMHWDKEPQDINFLEKCGRELVHKTVVTNDMDAYVNFVQKATEKGLSMFSKRMLRSKVWFIHNELQYRLKLPTTLSILEKLFLYGVSPSTHENEAMATALNYYQLIQCYLFDTAKNQQIASCTLEQNYANAFSKLSIEALLQHVEHVPLQLQLTSNLGKIQCDIHIDNQIFSYESHTAHQSIASALAQYYSSLHENP